MSWLTNVVRGATRIWTPQVTMVRYRYHADKIAKGPELKRYGYKDPTEFRGLLPRKHYRPIKQLPIYRPKNVWSERRALFGQNDYIDILGSDDIHPTKILYHLPFWLRGFSGKEYQVLIRKRRVYSGGAYPIARPKKWNELNKRIRWLYKFFNQKTKTGFTDKQ